MPIKLGMEAKLYYKTGGVGGAGAWTLLTNVKDVTLSLEDLNSTNRTSINGEMIPIRQVQMLHDDDEIMLGALRIRLSFQYSEERLTTHKF